MSSDSLAGFALDVAASLRADRGLVFHPLRLEPALTGAPLPLGAHHQSLEWDPTVLSPADVASRLFVDTETGERLDGGSAVEMWLLPVREYRHAFTVQDAGLFLRFVPRYLPEEKRLLWRGGLLLPGGASVMTLDRAVQIAAGFRRPSKLVSGAGTAPRGQCFGAPWQATLP